MEKKYKRKINWGKIAIALFVFILIIFGIDKLFFKSSEDISNNTPSIVEPEVDPDITIHMAAIGDIMCHSPNYKAAYLGPEEYDFTPFFSNITKYTSSADITIGNLETTFAGANIGYSGYPTFNSPVQLGYDIKKIGVDVVSTSNNHCMDKGYNGLVSTLDALDEIGLDHMGTYRSEEEQNKILVKEINGIKIAFLAFTYGTNGIAIPSGKEYSVNLIKDNLILEQLELAKLEEPDLICVNMHWGIEYQQAPNAEQQRLADLLFENGVDIILGSHPHVLQKMEKRTIELEDGTTKDGFVIYSLGNFFSNQQDIGTNDTVILDIQVTKSGETGKISIDNIEFTPVLCYNKGSGTSDKYRLTDLRASISEYDNGTSEISASVYQTFKNALTRIEKVIQPCTE